MYYMTNKVARTDLIQLGLQKPVVLALGELRQEVHEFEIRPYHSKTMSQNYKSKPTKPDLGKYFLKVHIILKKISDTWGMFQSVFGTLSVEL